MLTPKLFCSPPRPHSRAQFLFDKIIFAAKVCQLLLLFVDGIGQGGAVVGEFCKVLRILFERRSTVYGHVGHIVQAAPQQVHHFIVGCAVLFESDARFFFFLF